MFGIDKKAVTRAFMIPVAPQHEQYYRPYQVAIDGSILDKAIHDTHGGTQISHSTLKDVSGSILQPAASPADQLFIPGGMGQMRYAFFFEVTYITPVGPRRDIVTGFTEHGDIFSHTGTIDPNARFIINSISRVNDRILRAYNQNKTITRMSSTNQVLAGPCANHDIGLDPVAMRPVDIIKLSQANSLSVPGTEIIETRNSLSTNPKLSERNNAIASHMLADVTKAYIDSIHATGSMGGVMDDCELYADAMGRVANGALENEEFYMAMGLSQNVAGEPPMFRFCDLVNNIGFDSNTGIEIPRNTGTLVSARETTDGWNNRMAETSIAFSITHALPALMSRFMVATLVFSVTNRTTSLMDDGPQATIVDLTPMFDDTVGPAHMETLKNELANEIVRGILSNHVTDYKIDIIANLLDEAAINISINGQMPVPYKAPMFCDSLYSPCIGLNRSNAENISSGVESLFTALAETALSDSAAMGITANTPGQFTW